MINTNQERTRNIFMPLISISLSGYTDRKKARALLASDSRPLTDPKKMYRRYFKKKFTTLIFKDENKSITGCRYLNQIELERCMNLPEKYTHILNRNKAALHIGNGWTVDVIAHIMKEIKSKKVKPQITQGFFTKVQIIKYRKVIK